jgi:hypothetical protein
MRLTVFSHKPCWASSSSPSGYATDGGFPFQMRALSELFEGTTLVVPCSTSGSRDGEIPITGHRISLAPLTSLAGSDLGRKLRIPFWLLRNAPVLMSECFRADAVHVPIPGDIGTIGMLLAYLLRKPLFVRHCGNWCVQKTNAEHFWKWFMERFAGGRNVMLATGGAAAPPSERNGAIHWIFSTTLTEQELNENRARERPSGEHVRLIIACRQDREKGAGVVIQSLPLIFQQFPNASLDVVGDGAALPQFKALATDLGVSDRVTFHGKVNHAQVISLLKQSDLFCYPTTASDGFPKVVHEALACGLPVVTTRVSVLPQLISSGCGILIDEATPEALAQAVSECLKDTNRYRAMSAQSIATARQYSLERWRDTIGDLLRTSWGPLQADA